MYAERYYPYIKSIHPEGPLEIQTIPDEVMEGIAGVLLPEQITSYYVNKPRETKGIRQFPYFRFDSKLDQLSDYMLRLRYYNDNSVLPVVNNLAISTIAWIEAGWQGIENLANNPDFTANWTAGGHFLNIEEKKQAFITKGQQRYQQVLGQYQHLRSHGNTQDWFAEYGYDKLLEEWSENAPSLDSKLNSLSNVQKLHKLFPLD